MHWCASNSLFLLTLALALVSALEGLLLPQLINPKREADIIISGRLLFCNRGTPNMNESSRNSKGTMKNSVSLLMNKLPKWRLSFTKKDVLIAMYSMLLMVWSGEEYFSKPSSSSTTWFHQACTRPVFFFFHLQL